MNQQEINDAPIIELNGAKYPIPLLVPRQNRIVVPKIMHLMNTLTDGGKLRDADARLITTELYDDLLDIIYTAITRANPTFNRDTFLDTPLDLMEMLGALDVIMMQTGVVSRAKAQAALAAAPGEAQAVAAEAQTGTQSSQE